MSGISFLENTGLEREVFKIETVFGTAFVRIENMETLSVEVYATDRSPMDFNGQSVVYARLETTLQNGRFRADLSGQYPRAEVRATGYRKISPHTVRASLRHLEQAADEFAAVHPYKIKDRADRENARAAELADHLFRRIDEVLGAIYESTPERVYLP